MTPRQESILKAIVELYAGTAEPVGSQALCEQFNTSSATIRAEMADLERGGFIMQPHISAGRVPTDKGYRAYVNTLAPGSSPDTRTQAAITRRVNSAGEAERAIKNAVESLAHVTGNLGLATIGRNLYLSGMASLFQQPEFMGAGKAYELARLLDSLEEWLAEAAPNQPISVYIGRENPIGRASGATLIISRFESPYSAQSYIGVLGPTRQAYGPVIGLVEYTGRLLQEALN
ncbi:transcriptional regulator [Candidatus Saccharibacteria bacterium]|nr:transcriptional regulator [Candidatus Saccharibacteria bacterium]